MSWLMGVHEVAEQLGYTRQRVHQLAKEPGFPEPVKLQCGLVWTARAIASWQAGEPHSIRRPRPGVTISRRDPGHPRGDPWDLDAVRWLRALGPEGGEKWGRAELFKCLRAQESLVRNGGRIDDAIALAARHGVERRPDADGTTIHFFRTDSEAPLYPWSAAERRSWLRRHVK